MDDSGVVIRRAESRDMAVIVELWKKLADEHAARDDRLALRPGAEIIFGRWVGARLRDDHSCVLVVEVGGEVVGYLLAHIDEAQPIYVKRTFAALTDLYIEPSGRGRGVGQKLAEAAFTFFRERGIDHIRANASVANADGLSFWKKLGFSEFTSRLWRPL